MRALIVAAHGSRRAESNDEVRRLCTEIAGRLRRRFSTVQAAFLELAAPSISQAIDAALAAGATHVIVLPYFLASGRHVSDDIPAVVNEKRRQHPAVTIEIAEYVGANPGMAELILNSAERSGESAGSDPEAANDPDP